METRRRAELEKTHWGGAEKLQVLRQRQEAERVQDDRLLQTRAAERERDRATMQAHIAEVKRADRAGQTPGAPARSKAGDHWEAKDDRTQRRPGTVSEKLEEAARRRQQDRGRTHRRSWE